MSMYRMATDSLNRLHIVPPPDRAFEFYGFERGADPSYHDLLGIEQISADPVHIELRLIHLEEEMLDDAAYLESRHDDHDVGAGIPQTYNWLDEAMQGISLLPDELTELIYLLERWLDPPLPSANAPLERFQPIERGDLERLHVRQSNPALTATWYQYFPDGELQVADEVSLVRPPTWITQPRDERRNYSGLSFATFNRQNLADPTFDPLDSWGLAYIRVNGPALRNLVSLLKRCT